MGKEMMELKASKFYQLTITGRRGHEMSLFLARELRKYLETLPSVPVPVTVKTHVSTLYGFVKS